MIFKTSSLDHTFIRKCLKVFKSCRKPLVPGDGHVRHNLSVTFDLDSH